MSRLDGGLRFRAFPRTDRDGFPDHQTVQDFPACIAGRQGPEYTPSTHDGHAIREAQDLVQLVSDENDGASFTYKSAQGTKEGLYLGWREIGGWLVKDDDPRTVVQELHHLNALAPTQGHCPNRGLGINWQPEFIREPASEITEASTQREPHRKAVAERNVLRRGEPGDESLLLMDHADTQSLRRLRRTD